MFTWCHKCTPHNSVDLRVLRSSVRATSTVEAWVFVQVWPSPCTFSKHLSKTSIALPRSSALKRCQSASSLKASSTSTNGEIGSAIQTMETKQAMQKVAGLLDFIKQLKISKPLEKCMLATFYKHPLHTRKRFAPKVDGRWLLPVLLTRFTNPWSQSIQQQVRRLRLEAKCKRYRNKTKGSLRFSFATFIFVLLSSFDYTLLSFSFFVSMWQTPLRIMHYLNIGNIISWFLSLSSNNMHGLCSKSATCPLSLTLPSFCVSLLGDELWDEIPPSERHCCRVVRTWNGLANQEGAKL